MSLTPEVCNQLFLVVWKQGFFWTPTGSQALIAYSQQLTVMSKVTDKVSGDEFLSYLLT